MLLGIMTENLSKIDIPLELIDGLALPCWSPTRSWLWLWAHPLRLFECLKEWDWIVWMPLVGYVLASSWVTFCWRTPEWALSYAHKQNHPCLMYRQSTNRPWKLNLTSQPKLSKLLPNSLSVIRCQSGGVGLLASNSGIQNQFLLDYLIELLH
jgi:hypothetical protein